MSPQLLAASGRPEAAGPRPDGCGGRPFAQAIGHRMSPILRRCRDGAPADLAMERGSGADEAALAGPARPTAAMVVTSQ